MFKTALAGLDPSLAEASLLACLPDLIHWGVERIVLAHVIGPRSGADEEEYRDLLERCAVQLRAGGVEASTAVVESGDVASGLLGIAQDEGVDLVVLGSRSHNILYKTFLGCVVDRVIRQTRLPVLIERLEVAVEGEPENCRVLGGRPLDRILLATDLSVRSNAAEEAAVALAGGAGRVDCLTVIAPGQGELTPEVVGAGQAALLGRIREAGGKGDALVESGDAPDTILRVAQLGYTLIVLGKNGRGGSGAAAIGPAAVRVCKDAQVPVLMAPAGPSSEASQQS